MSNNLYLFKNNFINKNILSKNNKQMTDLKSVLTSFIRSYQPIFTFYLYRISKNIYKNTRGKSGKFMFTWKYVPVYKRLFIVSSWLVKELRLIPQRGIKSRLSQLIINLIKTPNKTWSNRVKTFSYNYVYRSCRKTLAATYTSVKS